MEKYSDNCFLFLGKTGVGKSLCTKNLTSNNNVIVSSSLVSCTSKICGYDAYIPPTLFSKELKYKVIDTPGLNDSFGRDDVFIDAIKTYLEDKTIKVKGIFIFLNFQDVKFDSSEKKIIKQIYNLVPLDNFWKYVTIVFSHYSVTDEFESLEEKRKRIDREIREEFKQLMNNAYNEEGIIKINTKDLRIEYINIHDIDRLDDPEKKEKAIKIDKNYLELLKKIFKELSKKEPLYSRIEDKILENQKVINIISYGKATLYKCKIKKFYYYNQDGKLIKEKGKILEKVYDKDIEIDRLKKHSLRAYITSIGAMVASTGCFIGSIIFPPAAPALLTVGGALYAAELGASAVGVGTQISDYIENKTYYDTDDLSNYEKD